MACSQVSQSACGSRESYSASTDVYQVVCHVFNNFGSIIGTLPTKSIFLVRGVESTVEPPRSWLAPKLICWNCDLFPHRRKNAHCSFLGATSRRAVLY